MTENDDWSRKIVILITIVIRITIKNLLLFPPRLEPEIFRVLGERDSDYTTESFSLKPIQKTYKLFLYSKVFVPIQTYF